MQKKTNSMTGNSLASQGEYYSPKMTTKSSVMSLDTESTGTSDVAEPIRTATVASGFSILTKSMIGSGLFVMAFACSKFGIIAATFMLVVAALVTWVSLRTLSVLAIEFKDSQPSFYSISEQIIPSMKWVIDFSVILNCLGASTGYVITAGDFLSSSLMGIFDWNPDSLSVDSAKIIIQVGMVLILSPLCFMKQLSGTKVANFVGLACLLYIVVTTFVYSDLANAGSELLYMNSFLSAMGAFPTFIFAFSCQMNVFEIANELRNPTVKRMNVISIASTMTGLLIYVPIMILPYLTFGSGIQNNYLSNLDPKLVPVQTAYLLAGLSVSISYVLQVHPLRRSILSIYYGSRIPKHKEEIRNRGIVVLLILMATFGIAVGLKKIDVVTNFTGLLGGNTMSFLMPSLLYLKHYGIMKDPFGIAVLAVLVFSVILYPLCLTGIIYDMMNA